MLALSIVGSATLLFSCTKQPKATEYDYETLMTESSENRTISMMENGMRSYTFVTPLMEGYSLATNPYQEFRRGIDMTTYTQDSLNLVDATITVNYAIYYENQRLWEAKGNVTIIKNNRDKGDTIVKSQTEIYTQQLFWNATTKKIYSNVDTKILQPDGWHFGVGFDADEDLKNIHFRKYSSEIEFDMSQPTEEELAEEQKKSEKAAAKSEGGKGAPKGEMKRDPKDANRGGADRDNKPSVNKPNNTIKPQQQRPNNAGNKPVKPNLSPSSNSGLKDEKPANVAPNGVAGPNKNMQNKQLQNNPPKSMDLSTSMSMDASLDGSVINRGAMETPAKRK